MSSIRKDAIHVLIRHVRTYIIIFPLDKIGTKIRRKIIEVKELILVLTYEVRTNFI